MNAQEQYKAELRRRMTKTARLLQEFKDKGSLTTADLRKYGTGCSSRLFELRKEGHDIKANYIKPGFYEYVYHSQDNTILPDNWSDIKAQAIEGDDSRIGIID